MLQTHSLRLVLHRAAINNGMLELLKDGPVDLVALAHVSGSPIHRAGDY